MNLLRLLLRLAALPGRLLIRTLDDLKAQNGVAPLGAFLRGCVHSFLWGLVLVACLSATITVPTPAPAPPPPVRTTPRYVPPPIPSGVLVPTDEEPTAVSEPVSDGTAPVYVPLPNVEDDDGEGWFCRRRRWC